MWDRSIPLVSMESVRHSSALTTPPVVEPLSLADFKAHARIDYNHEDGKITSYIAAARDMLERDTRRAFCSQTRTIRMDYLPAYIVLDRCPVQSITSITYYDSANALQTLSASVYESDLYAEPAIIRPAFGQTWPTTYDRINAVSVAFVAGYASLSLIPETAKQAIRMLAAHWYESAESVLIGTISKEIELSYSALCDRLKWGDYA